MDDGYSRRSCGWPRDPSHLQPSTAVRAERDGKPASVWCVRALDPDEWRDGQLSSTVPVYDGLDPSSRHDGIFLLRLRCLPESGTTCRRNSEIGAKTP